MTSVKEKAHGKKKTRKRDFSQFSAERCNSDLSSVDWDNIISTKSNNIDYLFSVYFQPSYKLWLSIFNLLINNIVKHAPIKNLSKRNIKKLAKLPWITKGLRTSIKVKNKRYTLGDSFSTDEVNFEILSLSNRSQGPYSCPAQLLKCACNITSPILAAVSF